MTGPFSRTSSVVWRGVRSACTTCASARARSCPCAGRRAPCARRAGLDVAAELHLGRGQQDQVVADPLEVGDQVRGQHDGQLAAGVRHGRRQRAEEVPPGQRVERRDRLVEQQHPRPLGQRRARAPPGRAGRRTACRPAGRAGCSGRAAGPAPTRRPSAGSGARRRRCGPRRSAAGTAGSPGRGSRSPPGTPGPGAARRRGRRPCRRSARPARRAAAAAWSCPRRSARPARRSGPRAP